MKRILTACVLMAACLTNAAKGDLEPERLYAWIAVPAIQGQGAAQIIDHRGRPAVVSLVEGGIRLESRVHQHLVEGVWGVFWAISEADRVKVRNALAAHGEAGLIYDSREISWWYEDRVALRGRVTIEVATKDAAMDVAHRISLSGGSPIKVGAATLGGRQSNDARRGSAKGSGGPSSNGRDTAAGGSLAAGSGLAGAALLGAASSGLGVAGASTAGPAIVIGN